VSGINLDASSRTPRQFCFAGQRQSNLENRPPTQFTAQLDASTMLGHDLVDNHQPEAAALVRSLGRKEGVKYPLEMLVRYSLAMVPKVN
jgi:hypothetical protein